MWTLFSFAGYVFQELENVFSHARNIGFLQNAMLWHIPLRRPGCMNAKLPFLGDERYFQNIYHNIGRMDHDSGSLRVCVALCYILQNSTSVGPHYFILKNAQRVFIRSCIILRSLQNTCSPESETQARDVRVVVWAWVGVQGLRKMRTSYTMWRRRRRKHTSMTLSIRTCFVMFLLWIGLIRFIQLISASRERTQSGAVAHQVPGR